MRTWRGKWAGEPISCLDPAGPEGLRKVDVQQGKRIQAAVRRFAATGEGDVKRLTDVTPPEYRLRVGDWRVRFQLQEHPAPSLVVLSVLPRDQAYR